MIPFFNNISTWILYRVWPYFLIGFAIVGAYLRKTARGSGIGGFGALPVVTAISGITMEVPLFILAPAADYRYSIWMVSSAILATVMAVADRRSAAARAG
jgi:ABC-type sulfate transport system permease subunit